MLGNTTTLPTLTDAYFDTEEEARKEMRRRRSQPTDEPMLVRCERTGYGTWRVYSMPVELLVDFLLDMPLAGTVNSRFGLPGTDWGDRRR